MKPHLRPALWLCVLLSVCLLPRGPAQAQVSKLDRKELIIGLKDQGMTDLLARLKETEGAKLDPVEAGLLNAALQIGAATDNAKPAPERAQALHSAIAILQSHPAGTENNPLWDIYRAMWQTELAEQMITGYVSSATGLLPEFYEFGVTTEAQKHSFAQVFGEGLAVARSSEAQLQSLAARLPDRPDFAARFRDSLYVRLNKEYLTSRTALVLAHAAYYVSLADDADPTIQSLAGDRSLFPSGTTPGGVKSWLQSQALARLTKLAGKAQRQPALLAQVLCLSGRIKLAQGQLDPAAADLQASLNGSADDYTQLAARLALASLAERRQQADAVQAQIAAIGAIPSVQAAPALRLLTYDLLYQAQIKKGAAVPDAVKVYENLVNDQTLSETARNQVRGFLYRRWFDLYNKLDPATLPPLVQQGLGMLALDEGMGTAGESQTARQQAQDLHQQAEDVRAKDPARALDLDTQVKAKLKSAEELLTRARPQLEKAQKVLGALLDRKTLPPALVPQIRFELARATLYLKPGDVPATLDAVHHMLELVKFQADQPEVAQTAVTSAVNITHNMMVALGDSADADAAKVKQVYQEACDVLFSIYGNTRNADNERMAYVQWVLLRAGDFDQAIAQLAKVPPGTEGYWPARQGILECYVRRLEQKPGPQAYDQTVKAARDLLGDSGRALDATPAPDKNLKETLLRTEAAARLALADLYASRDQFQQTLEVLKGWEERFGFDPAILARGLGKRVVALALAGQTEQFQAAAAALLSQHAQDAAVIIDNVLSNLEERIDTLRREAQDAHTAPEKKDADLARITALSDNAGVAADLLLDWARKQKPEDLISFLGLPDTPANHQRVADLLDWKIPKIKSLLIARQYPQALAMLEALDQTPAYKNYLPVMNMLGEARYGLGGKDNLEQARIIFSDLIRTAPVDRKTHKFPAEWWNAQMRVLEITDTLGEKAAADIPATVRRLRETLDPNLGGEPYRGELTRLENKYIVRQAGANTGPEAPAAPPAKKPPSILHTLLAAGSLIGVMLLFLAGIFIYRMRAVKAEFRARRDEAARAAARKAARKVQR